jgi:RNA polymerase sigma factor (sigma-70 family)
VAGVPEEVVAVCATMHPRLVGALSLYTGDRDVAQEIAQETLVRLCRDWHKVHKVEHLEGWLHRSAINLASSFYRRRAAERRARQRLQATRALPELQHRSEDSIALREALLQIPKRQRTVLILRFYADMSFREIATAIQTPEPTVKSLARRGLQRLRQTPGIETLKEASLV